jgi:hypothetical protein
MKPSALPETSVRVARQRRSFRSLLIKRLMGAIGVFAVAATVVLFPGVQAAADTNSRIAKGVNLGFNAKGTVDTEQQIALVDTAFASIASATVKSWTIRVTGGTRSQTDFPSDWSDAQIGGWIKLQQKYGFSFVYVVNGNDTPASQAAFISKWITMGAKFTFIEMMNEYYLSKYRTGDTSIKEVSRQVTAKQYVEEILPAFLPALRPLRLPFFVILAPTKPGKSTEWNDTVLKALKTQFASQRFGVTVHLYAPKGKALDYAQISRLRKQLPPRTAIAVTEAGVQDYEDVNEFAAASRAHLLAITAELKPGDYLLEQILYKGVETEFEGSIDPNGLTPKGKAVLDLYTAPRR